MSKRRGAGTSAYDYTRVVSCGKRGYPTRVAAKGQAAYLRASTGAHVRPYRCDECPFWHVGHLPIPVLLGACSSVEYYAAAAGRKRAG